MLNALGSRRIITLLFSDLCDSTRIAAGMDAEAYAELLEAVRTLSAPIIGEHGGLIAQIYGDGILSVFGAQEASASDVTHALETAISLHAAIRAFTPPADCPTPELRLHSGVHTGLVVLRDGDLARGRVEAAGLATGIAARLASAARRDEILVSERSLGPARTRFRVGPSQRVALDRASRTVTAVAVLGPSATVTIGPAASPRRFPFVGREAELARFATIWEGVPEAAGRCVALVAQAGQGKTRFAEELAMRAARAGCDVFTGSCSIGPAAGVLQPFRQIAADMLERARDEACAAKLRAFLARGEGGEDGDQSPGDSFVQALVHWSGRRPVLLVCDDWQSVDSASMQLLKSVTAAAGRFSLLLLTREAAPRGIPLDSCDIVTLPPLELEHSCALIRHCDPHLDPLDARKLHARAGGNPLYIEELCHHSVARSPAIGEMERNPEQIGWLGGLIGSRFAALSEDDAVLLHAAATIGDTFPLWLIEEVAGGGASSDRLAALAERDFLLAGPRAGWMRFKHGIAWEVIYSLVPLRARKQLHARVAAALEARLDPGSIDRDEALAWHYAASDQPREAALAAERAGDAATELHALDRAQVQYLDALAALEKLPMTDADYARFTSLVARFGMVSVFDPEPSHLAIFEEAVARAEARGDQAGAAYAEFWAAYLLYALGEGRRSIAFAHRALGRAGAGTDSPFTVQVRATLGQAEGIVGNYRQALALLDDVIDVKWRNRSGRQVSLGCAYSLTSKASILGDIGRFDEAFDAIGRALTLMAGAEHPVEASIYNWAGAIRLWQGRPDAALEMAQSARAVATRVETVYLHAMSRAIDGYARWRLGGGAEAVAALAEAVACMTERGKNLGVSLAHGWLAEAEAARDNGATARREIGAALGRAHIGDWLGMAMAARAAARLHRDRPRRALAWIRFANRAAALRTSPREAAETDLLEAELCLGWGDAARARMLLDRARTVFAASGMAERGEQAIRLAPPTGAMTAPA